MFSLFAISQLVATTAIKLICVYGFRLNHMNWSLFAPNLNVEAKCKIERIKIPTHTLKTKSCELPREYPLLKKNTSENALQSGKTDVSEMIFLT